MIDWKPIEDLPKEYYTNQKEVLLKTHIGVVTAWACIEEPTNDSKDNGYYDWICYDDLFRLDIDDSTITHYAEIEY